MQFSARCCSSSRLFTIQYTLVDFGATRPLERPKPVQSSQTSAIILACEDAETRNLREWHDGCNTKDGEARHDLSPNGAATAANQLCRRKIKLN
jgi:hypothetical protein